jgi:hypothetical protein
LTLLPGQGSANGEPQCTHAAATADIEKRRTITLTNRSPVTIVEDEWPVIAEGAYRDDHPSGCEQLSVEFRVRRNRHRQYLIHGKFSYYLEDVSSETHRVGRLLYYITGDVSKVDKALLEVGNEMRERVSSEPLRRYVTLALDACFAKLGPQAI